LSEKLQRLENLIELGRSALVRTSFEFHPRGHLRSGQENCNKCGQPLRGQGHDCWFHGPECGRCYCGK
jgi:hypothetical protein